MIPITQLALGDSFYFENDRATIFVVYGFDYYNNSKEIKRVKCSEAGKLYPHHFSWRKMVIKIKHSL